MNNTYYITFGQDCTGFRHPMGGHKDGWMEIVAEDAEQARLVAIHNLGFNWSFLYSEEDFDKSFFPMGCIKKLSMPTN